VTVDASGRLDGAVDVEGTSDTFTVTSTESSGNNYIHQTGNSATVTAMTATINAGAGNTTYEMSSSGAKVKTLTVSGNFGDGTDTIILDDPLSVNGTIDLSGVKSANSYILLADADDIVKGGAGADNLYTEGGDVVFTGNAGADVLTVSGDEAGHTLTFKDFVSGTDSIQLAVGSGTDTVTFTTISSASGGTTTATKTFGYATLSLALQTSTGSTSQSTATLGTAGKFLVRASTTASSATASGTIGTAATSSVGAYIFSGSNKAAFSTTLTTALTTTIHQNALFLDTKGSDAGLYLLRYTSVASGVTTLTKSMYSVVTIFTTGGKDIALSDIAIV